MCEIFGFSGNRPADLRPMLTEFFSHSPRNPDGWGLAAFDEGQTFVYKEKFPAYKSANLERIVRDAGRSKNLIAHIRLATIGVDEYENSHPFSGYDKSGRLWTLAHNGTIFESDELGIYSYRQKGNTDSERVFLYILDEVNRRTSELGHSLNALERFELIDEITVRLSPQNKLNLIIYDGEITYLHTNYKDSLYVRKLDEGSVFATVPLNGGTWDHLPFTRLVSYRNGAPFLAGTDHGNEYIPDEHSIRALYMAYAGL